MHYNSVIYLLASSSLMKKSEIDYKSAIVSIISESQAPMTVKGVLKSFEVKYGYSFPFEKFSCRTSMDFFRLHPALFKVPKNKQILYLDIY